MTVKANFGEVICPNCTHQFPAIPVNVQRAIIDLREKYELIKASRLKLVERIQRTQPLFKEIACVIEDLVEINEELLETMHKLACLGNGDTYGNSVGNEIAIAAIKRARE